MVFYNVENLFDTQDDPSTNDNDFLGTGVATWTTPTLQNWLDRAGAG